MIKFAAILVAALGTGAFAGPIRAVRKPASEQYSAEALSKFVDAILADKAGALDRAAQDYIASNRISPQANTYYNLGDVERRREQLKRALEAYQQYLALAPDAADRAEVTKLIDQLEHTPGTAVIDGEDADGVIFVDGTLAGPSPAIVHLPDGSHVAHRVSPTSLARTEFHTSLATTTHVQVSLRKAPPGNLVIASNWGNASWKERGIELELNRRLTVPPGHYETRISTLVTCSPIIFDVPRGDELTFVYIDLKPFVSDGGRGNCAPVVTRQQKVQFP